MRKLSQAMRVHALQPEIYDDDTIQGITWIIIGYGRQYFRQSLMLSKFKVDIFEGYRIANINIRLADYPIDHGNYNQSQRYTGKVEIPIHSILITEKQTRNR